MRDQSISHSAEVKSSLVQHICVLEVNYHSCEKNWTHTTSTSGSNGRLADEMQVEDEIFKISYRLNYSDFTSV